MTTTGDGWPPITEPPDPLPEAAHEALRTARVELWRDLWHRVERQDELITAITGILDRLDHVLDAMPRTPQRWRLARRAERLRSDFDDILPG